MRLVGCWNRSLPSLLCLCAALIGWALPVRAVIGTHDNVPAATLLLPYFEVDLDNPNGQTTMVYLTNASATAALSNVTLWSTEGVSLLSFNVYLVGYDMQAISLRDVLAGTLPRTASAGQDPTDTISPRGVLSQDINVATCTGILPPAPLSTAEIADLRAGLTGQPMPGQGGLCASANAGDSVARGFLTIDAVSACHAADPDEAGYATRLSQQNILFGEYSLSHPAQNLAAGDALVAIEAANAPPLNVAGNYTFYGAYNNGSAADRREPLAVRWAQSRVTESPTPDARMLVWRDTKRIVNPFNCGSGAAALRLQAGAVIDQDAVGNQQPTATAGFVAPQATQSLRLALGSGAGTLIEVSSKTGWLEFHLNHALPSGNLFGASAQSYPVAAMGSHSGAQGRFRVATPPVQLEVVTQPPTGAAP